MSNAKPMAAMAQIVHCSGVSLLFAVAKNAAVSVHYDFEGSDGFQSHTGQLVAQFWF